MHDPFPNNLKDAAQLWHQDSGPDLAAARGALQRALIRQRLVLGVELIITLAGLVTAATLLVKGWLMIGLATTFFSVFGGSLALIVRGRSVRVSLENLSVGLAEMKEDARWQKRIAWTGIWICAAALCFIAVIILAKEGDLSSQSTRITLAGSLLFVAINLLWSARALNRAQRRLDHLRTVQGDPN